MEGGPRVQIKATSSESPWLNNPSLLQSKSTGPDVTHLLCMGPYLPTCTTRYRTEFSMWAILASPLVVTTPLTNMAGCDDVNCVSNSDTIMSADSESRLTSSVLLTIAFDHYANRA